MGCAVRSALPPPPPPLTLTLTLEGEPEYGIHHHVEAVSKGEEVGEVFGRQKRKAKAFKLKGRGGGEEGGGDVGKNLGHECEVGWGVCGMEWLRAV